MTAIGIAPSRPPYLRFEQRAVEDRAASIEQGRYVSKDVDFVIVHQLGSRNTLEQAAEDWLRNQEMEVQQDRMPPEWLQSFRKQYAAFKAGQTAPVEGTSLRLFPALSKAMIENLIRQGVLTIEDLASLTESAMAGLGMGARDAKHKAQAWLDAAEKNRGASEIASLRAALENKDAQIAELTKSVNALAQRIEALGGVARVQTDPGAGLGDDGQAEAPEQPARGRRRAA